MASEKQTSSSFEMTEAQMKTLVRNTLMVAGQEMGAEGDHWPVIKNTITDVMNDWKELEIERNVFEETKKHAAEQLCEMERIFKTCSPEEQKEIRPILDQLQEINDAYFSAIKDETFRPDECEFLADENKPIHIKRAESILSTLEENHEE
ncbi:MAG: hypothetical protein WC612_06920 [Bdellovibrionales bacterium]